MPMSHQEEDDAFHRPTSRMEMRSTLGESASHPEALPDTGAPTQPKRRCCFRPRGVRCRFTVLVVSMVLVFAITFTLGEFVLVRIDNNGSIDRPVQVFPVGGHPPREGGVVLYGGIRKWDMEEKMLSIRFIPHQCDGPDPRNCTGLQRNASFFVDKDALGWGGFNASTSVLDWITELRDGPYDQVLDLDLKESPRSGQLNLNGLETDILYPFDWYKLSW